MIYMLAPANPRPSGGMRRLHHYVETLTAAGHDAAMVYADSRFAPSWFGGSVPRWHRSALQLSGRDLVVVPEVLVGALEALPLARCLVLDLNPVRRPPPRVYAETDLVGIVTISDYATELLSTLFPRQTVYQVSHGVDPLLFRPPQDRRSTPWTISYMTRRRGAELESVLSCLQGQGELEGWTVRPIEGMDEEAVGDALRETNVFISGNDKEGFGRPPLEALACACTVVGYTGVAGQEYFDLPSAHPVAENDILALFTTIRDVVRSYRVDPVAAALRESESARLVRERYPQARERDCLIEAITASADRASNAAGGSKSIALSNVFPARPRRLQRISRLFRSAAAATLGR